MGGSPQVTLDKSTLQPVGGAPSASGPVTLDKSTLKPLNDPTYAGNAFPELKNDPQSRTLYNMTAAMSGQKMATPEDEAEGEKGKAAGFESAGATALTSLGGELLAAPKLLQVAARDPATGQFVKGLATKEGSTLARQLLTATQAAGEAHPVIKQALIQGLGMLGVGGIAKALGWIGKGVE